MTLTGQIDGTSEDRDHAAMTLRSATVALVVGGLAGALIPGHAPGLGVTLSGVTTIAATGALRPDLRADDWRLSLLVTAGAFALAPTWTDATWIVGLAAIGMAGAAVPAATDARTWSRVLVDPVRALFTGTVASVALLQPFAALARRSRPRTWGPVVRTSALTFLVLLVFGGLFASADRAFASLLSRFLLPDLRLELWPARALVVAFTAIVVTTLVVLRPSEEAAFRAPRRRLTSAEWAIPLGALVVLFGAFVIVQIEVLFGGHDHVLDTTGLTYAEYARQGFFQLLVAAALVLVVVGATTRYASVTSDRSRDLRDGLLAVLCVLTLVVLASSLRRLGLYEEAFGFTRPRVTAHAIAWWLGAIVGAVLLLGRWRPAWLPRVAISLTVMSALAFVLVRPDAIIASGNVARFERTGDIDLTYLRRLSADAVPALDELPEPQRSCALRPVAERLAEPSPPLAANISRATARHALEQNAVSRSSCALPLR